MPDTRNAICTADTVSASVPQQEFESIQGWTLICQVLLALLILVLGYSLLNLAFLSPSIRKLSSAEGELARLTAKAKGNRRLTGDEQFELRVSADRVREYTPKVKENLTQLAYCGYLTLVLSAVAGLALLAWIYKA